MSSKNIFITGDSFAFHRIEPQDWPYEVAVGLNLKLKGAGYPGYSWWPSLISLKEYAESKDFKNTEYFIFVHTQLRRPLAFTESYDVKACNEDNPDYHIWETYVKYFYNYDFSYWAMEKYLAEINEICENKKIIHLRAFQGEEKIYKKANGIILQETMISYTDHRRNQEFWNYGRNHMEPEINCYFAQQLIKICRKYDIYGPKKTRNVWMSIHDAK